MYGTELRAPVDLVLGVPHDEEQNWGSIDPWVFRQQNIRRDAYTAAREQLRVAAQRNKDYYDLRVKQTTYEVGQWVYLYVPRRRQGLSYKWQRLYTGPHLIVEKMGPVNYRIQQNRRAKSQIVHVDKIKLARGTVPASWLKAKSPVDGEAANPLPRPQDLGIIPLAFGVDGIAQTVGSEMDREGVMPAVSPDPYVAKKKRLDPIFEDEEAELDAHKEATLCERPKRTVKKPMRFIEAVRVKPAHLDVLFCGAMRVSYDGLFWDKDRCVSPPKGTARVNIRV